MNKQDFLYKLGVYADLTESSLEALVPNDNNSMVAEAMRYSLLGGGKRIRAALVMAAAELCGGSDIEASYSASAIEMLHCYSLIHDDLPCMDNDDMRRGKPSCHKKFGEATALLAGDGLLTLSFNTLSKILNAEHSRKCTLILSEAAGYLGMIYGQELDLSAEANPVSAEELFKIHENKTGALIKASVRMGAVLGDLDQDGMKALDDYAEKIGLVFQIVDDILDCTSTTDELGKPVGSDSENNKTTYVSLFGIEKSKELAKKYNEEAIDAVKKRFGDKGDFLISLANNLLIRSK